MSSPNTAWAIDTGRKLRLPTADRLVLIVLAERANGHLFCWPSETTISGDTGLSERQVRRSVHALRDGGLIGIRERHGSSSLYTVIRPATPDSESGPPRTLSPPESLT
jgi:Helix-turn-helix domain